MLPESTMMSQYLLYIYILIYIIYIYICTCVCVCVRRVSVRSRKYLRARGELSLCIVRGQTYPLLCIARALSQGWLYGDMDCMWFHALQATATRNKPDTTFFGTATASPTYRTVVYDRVPSGSLGPAKFRNGPEIGPFPWSQSSGYRVLTTGGLFGPLADCQIQLPAWKCTVRSSRSAMNT